jgi:hypothetical protein
MIDLDVVALIEFFGVVPEPHSKEEWEFFRAPLFVKQVDGLELSFSVSAYSCDLRLELRRVGNDRALLCLEIPGLRAVTIEHGDGRQVLRATSTTHGVMELSLQPTLEINCDGGISV